MVIRVQKQDSAYLYQLLESYDGITSFSTVSAARELPYRDIVLHVPPGFEAEVEDLVKRIAREIPIERLGGGRVDNGTA